METEADLEVVRAAARRAEAAPYIDYPPTPWWFFPATGAWAAAYLYVAASYGGRPVVLLPALAVLFALEAAFFAWYRRYRGTWPSLRGAPPEVARAMRWYFVGVAVAAGAAIGAAAGAAVTFVAVTGGLLAYEHLYEAAARAVRERLS